jgi:periplasmic protein TonB
MKAFFTLLIIVLASNAFAQQKKDDFESEKILETVEHPPTFPGGPTAFGEYIGSTFQYPKAALDSGVRGRVVLTFVIERDGTVTDVKLVKRVGRGCDEEAIRVLKASPKWVPGMQNNRHVRVQYTLPISLSYDPKDNDDKNLK